nr:ribonuclease H-like domain, reverse transcriptase, RNA-dependent DNA polymerase [Tanacetum cinerariifolium]
MKRLAFCDYHNMIALLEKYEYNVDFHPIVDFVEAPYIRIETTDEGTKILATVDVYQMDVKSAFLYGTTDEEVYVMQPSRFQDPEFPARVYKVEKAMYGLH